MALSAEIGRALQSERFERASELIERYLAESSDVPFSTQLCWFMALPDSMILDNPALWPHAALVAAYEQRFDLSQRWLGAGVGNDPESVAALGGVTMQLVLAGDLPTLADVSARLVEQITETSSLWSLAHGSLVGSLYATGNYEHALSVIVSTFRSVSDTPQALLEVQAAARPVAACLLLELGRLSEARTMVTELDDWLADAPAHCSQLAPTLWARAMVALEEGDAAVASEWSSAPASVSALGLPFFEVWLLLDFARVRSTVGDAAGAYHALVRVQSMLSNFLQPGDFEARLNALGSAHGVLALPRSSRHRMVSGVELSAREQEVLLLLDSELTLGQMAQKLFISPNTLKAHTRSIYRKLGVTSRLSAVRAVRERI